MTLSTKELRTRTAEIMEAVRRGEEITITYRGKPTAKIVPIRRRGKKAGAGGSDELFGIWRDNDDCRDVAAYVDRLRGGRFP